MVDFDDYRDAAGSTSGGLDDQSLPEDIDFGNTPKLSCYPEVILDAEAIVEFGMIGSFMPEDGGEQNLRGPNFDWDDEGAVLLTLKNPEFVAGDLFRRDTKDRVEYKFVNLDSHGVGESATKEDGEFVTDGVEYGTAEFTPSELVDTVQETAGDVMDQSDIDAHPMLDADDTVVKFFFKTGRAQRVASVLDRVGGTEGKYIPDGEGGATQTKGLIEYPPSMGTSAHEWGKDPYPRLAGSPNIRTDVYGEPIRLVRMFDGDPTEAEGFPAQTINFVSIDEVGQPLDLETAFTAEDDRDFRPTEEDREYLPVRLDTNETPLSFPVGEPGYNRVYAWHDPEDTEAVETPDESVEDGTEDVAMADSGQPTYEDLDDGQQEFVDQMVGNGAYPEDIDFEEAVMDAIENDEMGLIDHEVLADIVRTQHEAA
jgi:hypothetical protein